MPSLPGAGLWSTGSSMASGFLALARPRFLTLGAVFAGACFFAVFLRVGAFLVVAFFAGAFLVDAFLAAAGDPDLVRRTWVLITESPDGGWGMQGHANTNADIAALARAALSQR